LPWRLLVVLNTTLGRQAGGVLWREDALAYRAGLLNETNAFEITLGDKLNDFAHVHSTAGNSGRCHHEYHPPHPKKLGSRADLQHPLA
jgi:hypothetical protein